MLTDYLTAAKDAALAASVILEEWKKKFQVREKARFDLVTDADVASQRCIHDFLKSRFPATEFLGEEDIHSRKIPTPDSPPTWIVDPIDGTTNYVHDFPFFCISIGLQIAGELVVGVVYEPTRKEMFAAAKGQGAYVNDQRLKSSAATTLEEALVATGFPPEIRGNERTLAWWNHFSFRAQSLRRTGSTALNLAYVAAGRFDAYYAFDNHVWDVAGGTVLVREAGGIVSNVDGTAYDPYTQDALATNGALHEAFLKEFANGPQ